MDLTLRILHLSDLHFKTTGADPAKSFGADLVTQSMIAEITAIMEKDVPFDLIIITGDLAFSGKKEEYKVAEAFCQKLLAVTTRPRTYAGLAILSDCTEYTIAPLDPEGIQNFLSLRTKTLFSGYLVTTSYEKHLAVLSQAVNNSPAIRRLALNPLMLTALAVIHWNEKRLPEQRAELYESIITWLLRSRENKPGRLDVEQSENFLQCLALAMQNHPHGLFSILRTAE